MCDNLIQMKNHNYKDFLSDGVINSIKSVDYCVGNLETPIVNNVKKNSERYSFCAPYNFPQSLKEYGFHMFSTANNHCLDCGLDGLKQNCQILEKLNIDYVGTNLKNKNRVFIKEINGIKIGFISYTYGTNAFLNKNYLNDNNFYHVNLSRKQETSNEFYRKIKNKFCENLYIFNKFRDRKYLNRIKEDVDYAKRNADIVIFLLHTGGQYNDKPEHYTVNLSKYLRKIGVDVIIGNHPHVVLNHKNSTFYSLGNFYATPYSNHNQVDDIPNYSIFLKVFVDVETKKYAGYDIEIFKTVIKNEFPVTYNVKELTDSKTSKEVEQILKKFEEK